ncbi:MAG: hypothetical protein HPY61_08915 [Methanotrichaceae archaeon]|nr:hypothetical protein [Methanotrichaceae archaeon]
MAEALKEGVRQEICGLLAGGGGLGAGLPGTTEVLNENYSSEVLLALRPGQS